MKNSIVTIDGIRGEYTGFSEASGFHHFSMYNGATMKRATLDGVEFEGTIFSGLFDAICKEWDGRHVGFVSGLAEFTEVGQMVDKWQYKEYLTPSKLRAAVTDWTAEELKTHLIKRHAKYVERRKAEQLAHLQEVEKALPFVGADISVEWKRSRMWGANPSAEVRVKTERRQEFFESGSIGGCGYDKGSTAVARALNQSPVFLRALYAYKEENGVNTQNHELFGYGAGYGVLPHLEGGVGVSCYPKIFKTIGYEWEQVGNGKSFDVYRVTKAVPVASNSK